MTGEPSRTHRHLSCPVSHRRADAACELIAVSKHALRNYLEDLLDLDDFLRPVELVVFGFADFFELKDAADA